LQPKCRTKCLQNYDIKVSAVSVLYVQNNHKIQFTNLPHLNTTPCNRRTLPFACNVRGAAQERREARTVKKRLLLFHNYYAICGRFIFSFHHSHMSVAVSCLETLLFLIRPLSLNNLGSICFNIVLPREACQRGIEDRDSVCPSVRRPSVTRVLCDKTKEHTVDILILH